MAIAPYNANARFVFPITNAGLTHEIHLATNSDAALGAGSAADMYGPAGAGFGGGLATGAEIFAAWLAPLYGTATTFGPCRLEKKLTTGWGLIGAHVLAVPHGTGSASGTYNIITCSMKAADNTYVKLLLPETNLLGVFKRLIGDGSNGAIDNLFSDWVSIGPDSGNMAGYFGSRSNQLLIATSFYFSTISKRIRKQRNVL